MSATNENHRSVVLVGCGRLGSAILEGWLNTDAVEAAEIIILTPSDKPVAEIARRRGARINPPGEILSAARAVVLAVKPAKWREAVRPFTSHLPDDAVIVSVMAGVRADALGDALSPRRVARVMPTTAVAQAQGVAAIWAADAGARQTARGLFSPLADIVDLDEEGAIDVATAVAGSGPAYVHAFTRALAEAGRVSGLDAESALRLARGAVRSAAAADPADSLENLIARVASPGGTTEAGLKALNDAQALDRAVAGAVAAALGRARELSCD